MNTTAGLIVWFEATGRDDVARVGGKNASLGEMVCHLASQGIKVPTGFATTAQAYWQYVDANQLRQRIQAILQMQSQGRVTPAEAAQEIQQGFMRGEWPAELASAITQSYEQLCARTGKSDLAVAVRSSATAEDLPDASFAGQQASFLNVQGNSAVLQACKQAYASLFTERAISYRNTKGYDHLQVALSIGVQQMVRADLGGAGVMFSLDTESGFDKVVIINAAWGLGETVVQGTVDPDEYQVFKPLLAKPSLTPIIERKRGGKLQKCIHGAGGVSTRTVPTSQEERDSWVLSDDDVLQLARWAVAIEQHYGMPMDMEWARDGAGGPLYIVQARPETVQSQRKGATLQTYAISQRGRKLLSGVAIGEAAVSAPVCMLSSHTEQNKFVDGAVLVAANTDPDWLPVMKRASAIVTDHGGRTSHAAIVSRELGLPAVIGTGDATRRLHDQQQITVSCAEGEEGFVYEGRASIKVSDLSLSDLPATHTQVMLNLANPAAAFRWWRLPADGSGLVRMEFVIGNQIRVHPMALANFDAVQDQAARAQITSLTRGYADKCDYFIQQLACGLGRIAAALYPRPVVVRMSDFKTNEYAHLLGGAQFEPQEENPMLGFRGASRYYSPRYQAGFALECRALQHLRERMGFTNVIAMIPFCRTPHEADQVLQVMAENGLKRGAAGLQVYVMCEIPSNVILAREFAQRFDGFSIGSNDLTQLTLGVDRDSAELAGLFNEQDAAVRWMIARVIAEAHAAGAKVGLCGQAPSDHPEFARFLVECGIDSMSVSPDSFVAVKREVAKAEIDQRARVMVNRSEPTVDTAHA